MSDQWGVRPMGCRNKGKSPSGKYKNSNVEATKNMRFGVAFLIAVDQAIKLINTD